jgi:hypothetical protein
MSTIELLLMPSDSENLASCQNVGSWTEQVEASACQRQQLHTPLAVDDTRCFCQMEIPSLIEVIERDGFKGGTSRNEILVVALLNRHHLLELNSLDQDSRGHSFFMRMKASK